MRKTRASSQRHASGRPASGNALLAVFAAIVLVGLVGASVSTFIKGPLSSAVRQTRMNGAKAQMQIAAQVAVMAAAAGNTNVDIYARVFQASFTHDGNLGGLAGADSMCQSAATAAGLPGTYMAWLSDNTQSPSTRFTKLNSPYKMVDGTLLANNWADLTDGTLATQPLLNEYGVNIGDRNPWSSTESDGTAASTWNNNCSNWTTNSSGVNGHVGYSNHLTGWSSWGCCAACNLGLNLYCVQQSATSSAKSAGDCDDDGQIEPLEWQDAGSSPKPTGGGLLPKNIGISAKDPWGTPYGYCAWDYGSRSLQSTCQQSSPGNNRRLAGSATDQSTPVVALISAGPDRTFSTTCRSYATADVNSNGSLSDSGDLPLVGKTNSTDDDVIFTYTYTQAMAASGGLWALKSGSGTTAYIAKKVEAGAAKFSGAGIANALAAYTGDFIDAVSGVRLPNPTLVNSCTGGNIYAIRRNATNNGIEMCNGTSWTTVAAAGGGSTDDTVPATSNTVFVTSLRYSPNLGGLTGGDQICQKHAVKANLPGKYMAWIADSSGSPTTRFNKSTVPYKLVDGTTIASNYTDLTDGTLAAPINKDEFGATVSYFAMTGVHQNGGALGSGAYNYNCWKWSDATNSVMGNVTTGSTSATNNTWTWMGNDACNKTYNLYCFQQTEARTNPASSGSSAGTIEALSDGMTTTSGNYNLYMGSGSGSTAAKNGNVAFGIGNLVASTGSTGNTGNIAFGYGTLPGVTNILNTGFGARNMTTLTGGDSNTTVGYETMKSSLAGARFANAFGSGALWGSNSNGSSAIGYKTIQVGNASAAIGALASTNTTGAYNSTVGYSSAYTNTSGQYGTVVGNNAAYNKNIDAVVAIGNNSLYALTTGTGNTAIGNNTLTEITSNAASTALGYGAGRFATGLNNVAVGKDALKGVTGASSGGSNTAIGSLALTANTSGASNTAAGYSALTANTIGSANSAAGYRALATSAGTVGVSAAGSYALTSLTVGNHNSALGYQALKALTSGSGNLAIGYNSGLGVTVTSGHVLIGSETQTADPSGDGITAIGYQALKANTGARNTAAGYQAAKSNVSGSDNTVAGSGAFAASTSGSYNTALGYQAMSQGTGNNYSSAMGANAARNISNQSYITAIGANALYSYTNDPMGTGTTAVGYQALYSATSGTNTGVGYQALFSNLVGTANTAVGYQALYTNQSNFNTAAGYQALYNNGYGEHNTAIGQGALYTNVGGSYNTAIGYQALASASSSGLSAPADCSFIGDGWTNDFNTGHCYFKVDSMTVPWASAAATCDAYMFGSYPAVISSKSEQDVIDTFSDGNPRWLGGRGNSASQTYGWSYGDLKNIDFWSNGGGQKNSLYFNWKTGALIAPTQCLVNDSGWYTYRCIINAATICEAEGTTTNTNNTAIGYQALKSSTSGSYNTAVGYQAMFSLTTGTGNTGVGYGALYYVTSGYNNTAVGYGAGPGNSNPTFYNTLAIGNGATPTANNAIRLGDTNITAITGQVALTAPSDKRLKKDIEPTDLGLDFIMGLKPVRYRLKQGNGRLDYGFLAQDIEEKLDGRVTNMIIRRNDAMKTYELRAADLLAPLVRALQEQEEMIDKLEAQVSAIKLARKINYCRQEVNE